MSTTPREGKLEPKKGNGGQTEHPNRTILSVSDLTVKSADKALMRASITVRVGTWLEIAHRTEVRLELMLNLGLIHRVQQQPSLVGGRSSMP